jgi:hypothetical protein
MLCGWRTVLSTVGGSRALREVDTVFPLCIEGAITVRGRDPVLQLM